MKLLVVSQDFPPRIGGIQTYTLELARRLAAWCERLEVIAPHAPDCEALDATLPFFVHRVKSSSDWLLARGAPSIVTRARAGRYDAAFFAQWTTAISALPARRTGFPRKVFVAAHGRELLLRPAERVRVAQQGYDSLRRWVLGSADGIFAVSHYTAGLCRDLGVDPARVHVVPNGVDAARFDVADAPERIARFREKHGLVDVPCYCTVARMVRHKGVDTGIAALPQLRQHVPDATYVVVGSGPDLRRLRHLARHHGVEDAVRFLGRVSDEEVVDALLACDAFALLSREASPNVEGFGLVLLEAGACGRPVVGARSGGIVDAVADGESGHLVEPDDVPGTAKALASILSDSAHAKRLGAGGRHRASQVLTWDRAARAIYDTIEASLAAR